MALTKPTHKPRGGVQAAAHTGLSACTLLHVIAHPCDIYSTHWVAYMHTIACDCTPLCCLLPTLGCLHAHYRM